MRSRRARGDTRDFPTLVARHTTRAKCYIRRSKAAAGGMLTPLAKLLKAKTLKAKALKAKTLKAKTLKPLDPARLISAPPVGQRRDPPQRLELGRRSPLHFTPLLRRFGGSRAARARLANRPRQRTRPPRQRTRLRTAERQW
eukprot:1146913-Prorocentrum_minimum.AAC.2